MQETQSDQVWGIGKEGVMKEINTKLILKLKRRKKRKERKRKERKEKSYPGIENSREEILDSGRSMCTRC